MGEGDSTVSVFDSAPTRSRRRSRRTARSRPSRGRRPARSPCASASTPGEAERRGADYFGPTLNLAARRARAGRRRPDLPLRGDGGPRRRGACRPAATSSTSARTGSRASRRPSGSTRCGPRADAPLPVDRVPLPRAAGLRGRTTARFFFGREDGRRRPRRAGSRPARLLAVVGASGSGKSSVLRAGLVAAVHAGEVAGIDASRCSPRAPTRGSTSPDDADAAASSTSSRSCSRCATTRRARARSSTRLLGAPGAGRDRRARRLLRAARAPTPGSRARSPTTRSCSAPMSDAELAARHHRAGPARRACGSSPAWSSSCCATSPASPAPCRCSRTRCAPPGSAATGAR